MCDHVVYSDQRIYITLRTDSPSLRLKKEGLSQPLSTCTDGSYTDGQVVQYTADRAERRLGECFPRKTKNDIHSLIVTQQFTVLFFLCILCTLFCPLLYCTVHKYMNGEPLNYCTFCVLSVFCVECAFSVYPINVYKKTACVLVIHKLHLFILV